MNNGIRYKLRMMGVPIEGSTNVYCDNKAVVRNSSMVELTLQKKYLSICYHKTRECYAEGVVHIGYKPTKTNFADVCTKNLDG